MKTLLEWANNNASDVLLRLNIGALEEDTEAVKGETGLSLPEDYTTLLRQHDGEDGASWLALFGDGNQLLPCKSFISQYKLGQEIGAEYHEPEMETIEFWKDRTESGVIFVNGPVKPLILHPKRLPMTSMNGCVFRYFDYDPAPGGIMGQIVEVDPENCSYEVLAKIFLS